MRVLRIYRTRWLRLPPPSCTTTQKIWLLRPGALTPALRRLGAVQLHVIAEHSTSACREDAAAMHAKCRTPLWIREVRMSIEGADCLVARSVMSLAASRSVWQDVRRLGRRPLASILYHDRHIQRSCFMYRVLTRGEPCYTLAQSVLGTSIRPILARCSVFWRYGQPLLVAESFLPPFWAKAERQALPSIVSQDRM
jgi:chorismate--pyruvate lyase